VRDLPTAAAAVSINSRVICDTRRFMVVVELVCVGFSVFAERVAVAAADIVLLSSFDAM
jgi:hypothetical protein